MAFITVLTYDAIMMQDTCISIPNWFQSWLNSFIFNQQRGIFLVCTQCKLVAFKNDEMKISLHATLMIVISGG